MTQPNLDELERKAKAARKGAHDIERRDDDCGYIKYIVYSANGDYASCTDELDVLARHNAAFIAAANPETVLSLIAAARERDAMVALLSWAGVEGRSVFLGDAERFYASTSELSNDTISEPSALDLARAIGLLPPTPESVSKEEG